MSIPDRLAYQRRLDYLWVNAQEAERVWQADSSEVNERRLEFFRTRYERAIDQTERVFGTRRQARKDGQG